MCKRYILVFVFLMLGLSFAQQLSADSLELMLENAKVYYNSGEYENAINELEKALQYLKQFERSDQVEAYKYLGFSYVARGDKAKAKEQFKNALALDPKLTLDPATVSPKIIKVFEEAKAEMAIAPIPPPVIEPTKLPAAKVSTSMATIRSCCLPGWGQMYKGQGSKGKKIMIVSGVSFGLLAISWIIQEKAHDKYLDVEPGNHDEMDEAYDKYKLWHNITAVNAALFIGVYLYNIYDVVFSGASIKSSMINTNKGFYCKASKDRVQIGYNINF